MTWGRKKNIGPCLCQLHGFREVLCELSDRHVAIEVEFGVFKELPSLLAAEALGFHDAFASIDLDLARLVEARFALPCSVILLCLSELPVPPML